MSKDRTWLEELRDVLNVHQSERRGVTALMLLFVLLFGAVVYEQWVRTPEPTDHAALEQRVHQWIAARADTTVDAATLTPFPFDPNVLERSEWLALGLSERQVDGILRYRDKGGRFRSKRDLARMYTLPGELYAQLEPYIQLPDSLPARGGKRNARKGTWGDSDQRWPRTERTQRTWDGADRGEGKEGAVPERRTERSAEARSVEVNSADSASLVALPGVGPAFARGILKFRDKLGGYHSLDQLAEVYVLKDKPDALERLRTLLVVDPLLVRKLPINTCTVEELAAHPYAGWKVAKPLIAYRKNHGPFAAVEDIRACQAVGEEVLRKLAPYLTVE